MIDFILQFNSYSQWLSFGNFFEKNTPSITMTGTGNYFYWGSWECLRRRFISKDSIFNDFIQSHSTVQ